MSVPSFFKYRKWILLPCLLLGTCSRKRLCCVRFLPLKFRCFLCAKKCTQSLYCRPSGKLKWKVCSLWDNLQACLKPTSSRHGIPALGRGHMETEPMEENHFCSHNHLGKGELRCWSDCDWKPRLPGRQPQSFKSITRRFRIAQALDEETSADQLRLIGPPKLQLLGEADGTCPRLFQALRRATVPLCIPKWLMLTEQPLSSPTPTVLCNTLLIPSLKCQY